jgi:hypothetical protein
MSYISTHLALQIVAAVGSQTPVTTMKNKLSQFKEKLYYIFITELF